MSNGTKTKRAPQPKGKTPTLEQVIDATSRGVVITDPQGRVILVNTRAEEILAVNRKEVLGEVISKVMPAASKLVFRCLESGEPQIERQIVGKDVSLVQEVTGVVEGGRIQGAVCTFTEIQDLESSARGPESYKRINEQWNTIFRSSSDGILVCDHKGNVITMNEASERLNGMKAKDVIGRNVVDFVNRGFFDRSVTMEVVETKRQVSILQYIQRTGRHLLVTGTPAFDEEGNIFLVVVNERDMTQLNALKQELEQTRLETEKFREELAKLSLSELKEEDIGVESEEMREVFRNALKLAHLGASNILLLGESGTGKGMIAKFIHKSSKCSKKPFIQINCATLPENLLEAELFGYEKGAFTGAREEGKAGLFELARDGTLFLDEIGDLPLSVQAKLLKYLDDHEILPLGGLKPRKVNCTIIAATNRDLDHLTGMRKFRTDLFYRLNTFPVRVPALRERREDIFGLTNHFLDKYNRKYNQNRKIAQRGFKALQAYPFPGNVRELKNLVKKAVLMGDQENLDDFIIGSLGDARGPSSPSPRAGKGSGLSFTEEILVTERNALKRAMRKCGTTREMAVYLEISQATVVRKMRKHALSFESMRK